MPQVGPRAALPPSRPPPARRIVCRTAGTLTLTLTPADHHSTIVAELEEVRGANAGQHIEDARRERRLSQEGLDGFARLSQVGRLWWETPWTCRSLPYISLVGVPGCLWP